MMRLQPHSHPENQLVRGPAGRVPANQLALAAALMKFVFASKFHQTFNEVSYTDHNEALRKFEHLLLKRADQAQEAVTELEALLVLLPNEKSRQLAGLQVKANHQQAKEFRELAQKITEK